EGHGVVAVEAVAAVAAAGALRALDERRAILVMREWHGMLAPAEVPTPAEEILRAGAVDHRHGLVVDENHLVAFAPPILLVLHDAQRHAQQMAAATGLAIDVIELAIEVLAV